VIKAERGELIVLPLDKAEVFQRNLAAHGEPLVSWQAYTVKRSDKPERIAARHGMTLAQLKAVNTIAPNHRIAAGQTLIVPVSGDVTPNLPDLPTAALASAPAKGKARSVHVANRHAAPVKVARVSSVRKPAPHASRAPAKRSVYAARTTKKQPVGRVKVSVPGRKVALAEAGKSARQ
jgi:LysM repeat protein